MSDWSWESRTHLKDHPLAPGGLVAAYLNQIYSVQAFEHQTEWGKVLRVGIRRHAGTTEVPWADKQRIKDELFGPYRVAVEVFPAKNRLVDAANMYWLWVLPEGFPKMPVAYSLQAVKR